MIEADCVYLADVVVNGGTVAASACTAIPSACEKSWREELSEAGYGSLALLHGDPLRDLDWLPNMLVNFSADETLDATVLVEKYEDTVIDRGEESAQAVVYGGRLHVSLLDRIVLYPVLGPYKRPVEEDWAANYTNPAYDDSGPEWVAATAVTTVATAKTNWYTAAPEVQWDADFPDDTAEVLWASDGTLTTAGVGDCYGRQPYTLAAGGEFVLNALCDNYGEVFSDGVLVVSPGQSENLEIGFLSTSKITLELTAGAHVMAWKNTNAPSTVNQPAGLAWALYESAGGGELGALVAHSDSADALLVEYASEPPGMTPGAALILALDLALARAADPLVQVIRDNLTFDEENDSNGDPWPVVPDIATKTGSTVLTLAREGSATYIEFDFTPRKLEWNAWIKGNRNEALTPIIYEQPTNPLDETSGNLLSLTRKGAA